VSKKKLHYVYDMILSSWNIKNHFFYWKKWDIPNEWCLISLSIFHCQYWLWCRSSKWTNQSQI